MNDTVTVSRVVALLARKRVPLGFATTIAALVLAQPTWVSWQMGLVIAMIGEAVRVWAAGHLEKGREVTSSGPYQWVSHPLYVGSSILALGVVIAARSIWVGLLALVYMGSTIAAAIRTEEAFLRDTFGDAYDRYQAGDATTARRFSFDRAMRNREYRAMWGLAAGFAILALKVLLSI